MDESTINYNCHYYTQGYTCAMCQQFVANGLNHVCTFTVSTIPPPTQPQPDLKYFQLILIGQILERIAQSLEQIEKRLPAD